jgi:hypothetical protein
VDRERGTVEPGPSRPGARGTVYGTMGPMYGGAEPEYTRCQGHPIRKPFWLAHPEPVRSKARG